MKYNDDEVAKLIAEVENSFKEHLSKAEQSQLDQEIEDVSLVNTESDFDYDESDIEQTNKMYASMSKSEKEIHYQAIKTALFGETEEVKKSEEPTKEIVVKETDEKTELLKAELENSKKETEDLKKSIETLTSVVTKLVKKAPARKAITQIGDIQFVKKSEETEKKDSGVDYSKMQKAEINKILSHKIRNGEITKSEDKENIKEFCFGRIGFNKIEHLLK